MSEFNWWDWQCPICGWKTVDGRTVNNQQQIAQALAQSHVEQHERASPTSSDRTKP